MNIPQFQRTGNLPQGIHVATWNEVETTLGFNPRRLELLAGMKRACESFKKAGCDRIYIGGSFASSKEFPGDFDVCWKDDNVNFAVLKQVDPVLLDFRNKRAAQKAKYGGEMFPASTPADNEGNTYLEFFQKDRDGNPRGIIAIDL